MRHGDSTRRWHPPRMMCSLVVTLAVALAWMTAVAATY